MCAYVTTHRKKKANRSTQMHAYVKPKMYPRDHDTPTHDHFQREKRADLDAHALEIIFVHGQQQRSVDVVLQQLHACHSYVLTEASTQRDNPKIDTATPACVFGIR